MNKTTIDAILEKRRVEAKKYAEELTRQEERLAKLTSIKALRRKYISALEDAERCETVREIVSSERTVEDLISDVFGKKLDSAIDLAQKAVDNVRNLAIRYGRETLDVAVIGRAGVGKSKLLQTISGLDNSCIPSYDGDHCT